MATSPVHPQHASSQRPSTETLSMSRHLVPDLVQHGVRRTRDQERAPVAADPSGLRAFALAADVSEAHRQDPARLASAWLSSGGRFDGLCKDSRHLWRRLGLLLLFESGVLPRQALPVPRWRTELWHTLVADDYHLETAEDEYRLQKVTSSRGSASHCSTALKRSASPNAVRKGMVLHEDAGRGIPDYVHMTTFEQGSSRVMYVVGALEYERLFFAPPCKFMTIPRPNSCFFYPVASITAETKFDTLRLRFEVRRQPYGSMQKQACHGQGLGLALDFCEGWETLTGHFNP